MRGLTNISFYTPSTMTNFASKCLKFHIPYSREFKRALQSLKIAIIFEMFYVPLEGMWLTSINIDQKCQNYPKALY